MNDLLKASLSTVLISGELTMQDVINVSQELILTLSNNILKELRPKRKLVVTASEVAISDSNTFVRLRLEQNGMTKNSLHFTLKVGEKQKPLLTQVEEALRKEFNPLGNL